MPSPPTAPGTVTDPISVKDPLAPTWIVDDSVPTGLDIEELSADRRRSVNCARVGRRLPPRVKCRSTNPSIGSPTAAGIGDVEESLCLGNPARCRLTGAERRWRSPCPPGLRVKVASAFVPASAMTKCPAASNEIANGTVPGSELTTGVGDRHPNHPTPKHIDVIAVGLGRDDQLRTVGGEGNLTRGVHELGRCLRVEAQGSV